jgi:hypothetical protein
VDGQLRAPRQHSHRSRAGGAGVRRLIRSPAELTRWVPFEVVGAGSVRESTARWSHWRWMPSSGMGASPRRRRDRYLMAFQGCATVSDQRYDRFDLGAASGGVTAGPARAPPRLDRRVSITTMRRGRERLTLAARRPRIRRGDATTGRAWSAGIRSVSPPTALGGRAASGRETSTRSRAPRRRGPS